MEPKPRGRNRTAFRRDPAASRLRAGTLTRAQLEDALRRMFVKTRHRQRGAEVTP
jgi:hypothetical protein